ncbi:methyltransferase family protein [Chromatocurvus halotolerans]|uniref:NnrU protein n=1 Tax=Chromatocurvus halotolerans TaxID=1132028 RepID=A0A4R2KTM7_9GAMM|nr:isoprenylcysteine carboxylmethyltransferase family protein [Chromatocurvus halotolerans]TCO74456.1 NnrU protein [Chromatocurvus halotolerans]
MSFLPPPQLRNTLRLLTEALRPAPGGARIALAVGVGAICHGLFAVAAAGMIGGMATGMSQGLGAVPEPWRWPVNLALIVQFPLLHSLLLGRRGSRWLARLLPGWYGETLSSTSYVIIASLQLLSLFVLWTPSGVVWWQAEGWLRWALLAVYASTWLLLLKATVDAGIEVQSGALGWLSLLRGGRSRYPGMPVHGLFRRVRHPIYAAFILTLWTVPVWTPDQLMLALFLTVYCLVAPRLKEQRYLQRYGEEFRDYRRCVPYLLPVPGRRRHDVARN